MAEKGFVDIVLGLQWGDEGKGKIADFLTPNYDVVARFQGGPNAGHSLEINSKKHVLNTIPSGIFHENCINLIGNGVVVDPVRLMEEIKRTEAAGANVKKNLYISRKANLILPTHKLVDAASEQSKGDAKIGSTLRGIGPTYRDKYDRSGLRLGDIFLEDFNDRYTKLSQKHLWQIEKLGLADYDLPGLEKEFFASLEELKNYQFVDSEYFANELLNNGKKILAEGAQGSMLDVDFGSYPFVTSSNTISGGMSVGLGIAPKYIRSVKGIFKAYCTRVGSGPFPSELHNIMGEELRKKGFEFGATTGRPRRCGWLDLVALKYAVMLSGVDELIMMKSDVLSGFEEVKVGVGYKDKSGNTTHQIPFDFIQADLESVYESHAGWSEDLTAVRSEAEFPQTFANYIHWLENQIGTKIKIISLGPDRVQTVVR
ncbi:MAG: adenylosuccinate synthase [Flavobacteriales bacterium]|nr:adenylosuccinate synthase [Flavobacteriales bacterium]